MVVAANKGWLDVDRRGLAQLIGDRGKEFIIFELLQNAWDEASSKVTVEFYPTDTPGTYSLKVTDDNPEGFKDITHAFTLFAPSAKKDDPEKRGRFNLGEKLVLALCKEATITTTTGSIIFDDEGRRTGRKKTEAGTVFSALIRMNREEYESALREVKRVLPPPNITTVLNGETIWQKPSIASFETTLQTVNADSEGVMRPTRRRTTVEVHEKGADGQAWLYEMGIPVVETGDRWSYNVMQKVPLNSERTDVTPAYKKEIRTAVVNSMVENLSPEDTTQPFVRDALASKDIKPEVVVEILDKRFGEKRVIFDSTDPEANKRAMAEGYTVMHSRQLSKEEWDNVKKAGAALPASKVTPSPKPFSADGRPLKTVPQAQWTQPMWRFQCFANLLAEELLGSGLASFTYADDPGWGFAGAFGKGGDLTICWRKMGRTIADAFERDLSPKTVEKLTPLVDLLIHEFAHYYESDHLSENYYRTLTKLGAKMTTLALRRPDWFTNHTGNERSAREVPSRTTLPEESAAKLF